MKQPHIYAAAAGFAIALAVPGSVAFAAEPTGVWLDDTGRGAVEIKPCGSGVCGYVVAVKNPNDTKGCGKQIIGDAKPVSGGRWDNGWIYSPEKRKNYDVELKPLSNGTLRVVGYAGTKLFSRTMIWTQAPADMKRCDSKDVVAPAANEAAAAPAKTPPTAVATEQPKTAAIAPAAQAKVEPKPETAKPAASTEPATEPANEVAEAAPETEVATEGGEAPGERSSGRSGGLKIGDLDLEKVLSRTASGKCKLDLPWVKVQFNCERE